MPRNLQTGFSCAALIAYGGWAVLALLLVGGTLGSMNHAERAQTGAMMARAEAGAVAVEQTMLRVMESVATMRDLAQTRLRLIDAGNTQGVRAIEQQLRDLAAAGRFGVQDVGILRANGDVDWTSVSPGGPDWLADLQHLPPAGHATPSGLSPSGLSPSGLSPSGLSIEPPVYNGETSRWSLHVTGPLTGPSGALTGQIVVWIDPIVLSDRIRQQGAGEVSIVQRRPDGAFLARSEDPVGAMHQKAAPDDPAFHRALRAAGGQMRDTASGVDRLVGFRAPDDLPVVVTQTFNTGTALADFFALRQIVLAVILALVVGALIATRLILANYLLRRRLGEQALSDPLTLLHNRRYFTDVMTRRLVAARRAGLSAAVLLIDLDGFKQVNDTRGHPVGDALLRQVADRLKTCVSGDGTVLRLGGDEFAVIRFGRQQKRDATALARYVVERLGEIYEVEGYHLRISASVGIAIDFEGAGHLHDLLRSADIALYFVKSDGGGGYQVFNPDMERTVRTRRALEIDLRQALARGELEVYFQPLVQLEPRRVSGFEALLRWHHPTLGMILPSAFIPIAEETGLIAEIGAWVLRAACLEAARWPGSQRIAVNLSPVQFDRSDIVDIVEAALRESGLDATRLELEITEGVVMRDMGDALATMHRLRALGVRLALDDFGTGYSSLSYLRSFPFDKVKIDGSFLSDIHGDGGTIIRAVLGLCVHLELDTLVEGVEREDQLHWLRMEGCTEVQGHLFSPPRPASGVAEIVANVAGRISLQAPARLAG